MDPWYRRGLSIVSGTVILAIALCLLQIDPSAQGRRAAQDLGAHPHPLGLFHFTNQAGRPVTDADLAGRVWIASFVFTRCPASCPKISAQMKWLQGRLARTGVKLISISVDPEHDTPEVLADYARRFGADPDRWWFLTGPKQEVYDFILKRFQLGVAASSTEDQKAGAEAVSHSAKLALVDRGNKVVGYYDSDVPQDINLLRNRAEGLDTAPPWIRRLPAVNASLNATSAVFLLLGWWLIRTGRVRGHVACMILAVSASALFLTSYLYYHYHVGSVPFGGLGPARVVYFTILLSHTVLALVTFPLAIVILRRAVGRRFPEHVRLARLTLPIWLYVSISGVLIYLMLYQLPVPNSPGQP